jgi:hypothetical protein
MVLYALATNSFVKRTFYQIESGIIRYQNGKIRNQIYSKKVIEIIHLDL